MIAGAEHIGGVGGALACHGGNHVHDGDLLDDEIITLAEIEINGDDLLGVLVIGLFDDGRAAVDGGNHVGLDGAVGGGDGELVPVAIQTIQQIHVHKHAVVLAAHELFAGSHDCKVNTVGGNAPAHVTAVYAVGSAVVGDGGGGRLTLHGGGDLQLHSAYGIGTLAQIGGEEHSLLVATQHTGGNGLAVDLTHHTVDKAIGVVGGKGNLHGIAVTGAEQRVLRHHLLAVLVPNDALHGATGIQEIDVGGISVGEFAVSGAVNQEGHLGDGGVHLQLQSGRVAGAVDLVAVDVAAVGLNNLQRAVHRQGAAHLDRLGVVLGAADGVISLTEGDIGGGVNTVPAVGVDDHLARQIHVAVFHPDAASALVKGGDLDVLAAELYAAYRIHTGVAVDSQAIALKGKDIGVDTVRFAHGNDASAVEIGRALRDVDARSGLADHGETAVHVDVMVLVRVGLVVNVEAIHIADDGAAFYGQGQFALSADTVLT